MSIRKLYLSNTIMLLLMILAGSSCKKAPETAENSQAAQRPDAIAVISNEEIVNANAMGVLHAGGIFHTEADYERMRVKVNAGVQPWKGGWDKLLASPHSSPSWTSRATATVIRGGTGDNVALLINDMCAAYQNALIYKISGNTANGNKARDILNSWSATLTTISGNADRFLAFGLYGYQLANAGEMMRGYNGFDVNRFRDMLVNIFYPGNNDFLLNHNGACITNYWANWDLCNIASVLAIGIFADDQAKIDQAINYFKTGPGNGSILNAVPFLHPGGLGQWQESGRDQPHSVMGVGLMGTLCEMAWNQGIDLYSYSNSRFRMGAEYVASYNNGISVPFTTYNWGTGQNCAARSQTVIAGPPGTLRPVYEMISAHYSQRLGISVPQITASAQALRPEGGPGGHASSFDHPGYGTLTYYRDASSRPIANGTYSLKNRASGKMLDNYGITSDGAVVKQYADGSSNNQKWTVSFANGYYKIICVTGGKALDSYNNSANGSTVHQWTNGASSNQQWQIVDIGGGYCKIFNRANGKCLDSGGSTIDGANMQFWPSNNSINQQWTFVAP